MKILQESKNLYTKCPNCQEIFSFHEGGLLYGKTNSNDILKDMNKKHGKEINTWEKGYSQLQSNFDEMQNAWLVGENKLSQQKDLYKHEILNYKDREKSLKRIMPY